MTKFSTNKTVKSNISLRQLVDVDESDGSTLRYDNIRHGQVLVSYVKSQQAKTFSFKYLSSFVLAGTGIGVTEIDGSITIANTGVTSIIAGTNVTIDQSTGDVTINATGGGGSSIWGSITGTLSSQTDLQTALNAKYDATNPAGYITSAALLPYLTSATAAATYYPLTNPSGYITSASLTGYVPTSRTLNINGTSYDLSADRSWTVGDLLSSGSYADPSWLTSLAYSKLTGTPTLGTWAAVNYPAWVSGTPFVKMTAAGTFALDTNTYQTSNTTVFVGNANGAGITNGARGSIYLGGTPVATVAVTAGDYGSAAAAFMPGYPMPAGVASKMRVITRSANPATNSLQVYVANATASVLGAKVTIAAGSAAGVYATDDGTTVSFSNGDRLYCIAKNPNVVGGATSAQITTVSFNFSLS